MEEVEGCDGVSSSICGGCAGTTCSQRSPGCRIQPRGQRTPLVINAGETILMGADSNHLGWDLSLSQCWLELGGAQTVVLLPNRLVGLTHPGCDWLRLVQTNA